MRAMIEVGAAERFAELASEAELVSLGLQLDALVSAHAQGDGLAAADADWAFHDIILQGCRNPFLLATMQPLGRALREARRATSNLPVMREHAITEHGRILEALRAGDRAAARAAMRSHMRQTQRDSERYF
ncbi:FCD domain-containing protein [Tessaracoccus sp. HDW20]|nr:FCD domain-containing protein [Tessaracoccus coleopterorum]